MISRLQRIAIASLLVSACGQTASAPPAAPGGEVVSVSDANALDAPPDDPGADVALPPGMRVYYMVLLRRGPAWSAEETPESRKLGEGHMAHIQAMASAGKLLVAGPFLGQTDARDIAGVYIFDAPSLAATKALAEADPAVVGGRFVPEYLVWAAADGLTTKAIEVPTGKLKDKPAPCASHTDFDFWIGQWEVRNQKGELAGTNRIERGERGCVLLEHWRGAKGGTGMSVNYVDPSTDEWVQLWVDDFGGVIRLRGKLEEGAMFLVGDYTSGDKKKSLLRGRWTPNPDGTVRQHFEESKDGGKSWKTWFDGIYSKGSKDSESE